MRGTLIVDADAVHARMLVESLDEAGWPASAVTGLAEALARLHSSEPALVVSDVGDGDGFELLRAIRSGANPVPVILMSSFGAGASPEQALAAGAFAYLRKPFDLSELIALVARALDDRQTH